MEKFYISGSLGMGGFSTDPLWFPRGGKKQRAQSFTEGVTSDKLQVTGHKLRAARYMAGAHSVVAGVVRQSGGFYHKVSQRLFHKGAQRSYGLQKNLMNLVRIMVLAIFFVAAGVYAQPCVTITTVGISSSEAVATTIVRNMDYYGVWKNPAGITFTASAGDGSAVTAYEWYVDGGLQSGEAGATFVFTPPAGVEAAYSVYAAAVNGCTKSNTARSNEMMVFATKDKKQPCISQGNPAPVTNMDCPGSTTLYLAAATYSGSGSVTYQWEESSDGVSWTNAPGLTSTNADYTTPISENSSTYYRRKAICDCGTITSTTALVTVNAPCTLNSFEPDPGKYVDITVNVPVGSGGGTKTYRYLTYNLGANPDIAVKDQMNPGYAVCPTDIRVYGSYHQWGRKNNDHAFRCAPNPDANSDSRFTTTLVPVASLGSNSDPGIFVYGSSYSNFYDWVDYSPSSHVQNSNLWGNGGGIAQQTNLSYSSNAPFSTNNTQNPCPSGFRVPTQHEWALLGHEAGNPTNATNDGFAVYSNVTTALSSGLVWVRVRNGEPNTLSAGSMCGYALYTTSEWNKYDNTKPLYASDQPAEPLLFLPAAGVRIDNGTLYSVGTTGQYWSSVVGDGFYSNTMFFWDTASPPLVSPTANTDRSVGCSVRCVGE